MNYGNNETIVNLPIDGGVERCVLRDKSGKDMGSFSFTPTDLSLIGKMTELGESIDEIIKPLQSVPAGESLEGYGALEEATRRLYSVLDRLFGEGTGHELFREITPFSRVHGKFYCERAMEAVGTYVAQRMAEEIEQLPKIKQTHGQRFGKHSKGKRKLRK